MLRPILALALLVLTCLATARSVFEAVVPPEPPAGLEPAPPVGPPLTGRLLLLIVDGLRYDVATDPERMPHFSRAMREHTSGEIWCGRISMTTSAVMAYGTGQRGRLEQILRNVKPEPPPYDNWLAHAKRAGLRLMSVGDPAWPEMYGRELERSLVDPKGVAIDVDFNAQTFRDVRHLRDQQANVLIAHFVTPDHQGHAYGIPSPRYRRHIRGFDRQLHELLAEFGPEWTVIVTSDHGAADSGTHGTDTPVQRRSPIYAYGPGIAPGVHPKQRLDQVDLAGTMTALLGVAAPAHGIGHLLIDWLDVPAETRAELACADARRALRYGTALLGTGALKSAEHELAPCTTRAEPSQRIGAARAAVSTVDRTIGSSTGLDSRSAWLNAALAIALAAACALAILGRPVLLALPPALLLGAVGLSLVLWVERLPGVWPNVVRVLLFTAGNAALLALLLGRRLTRFLDEHAVLAPLVLPGLLLVTYTSNTQPQSYVLAVLGGLFLLCCGPLGASDQGSPLARLRRAPPAVLIGAIVCMVALAPAGLFQKELYPAVLYARTNLALGAAVGWAVLWVIAHWRGRRYALETCVLLVCVVGSLLLRRAAPPLLGRFAILAFAALAIWAVTRRRTTLALGFGVASYAWVSRDLEFLAFVPVLGLAELLARRGRLAAVPGGVGRAQLLLLVGVVFGLLYVQRIGLQGAIDIGSMDWGAGGFKDPHVPAWLVGTAIAYKYVIAELLVVALIGAALDGSLRITFLKALAAAYVARTAILLAMLFVCGSSFWTSLRVLGDLPFGMTGALACMLVWLGVLALEPSPLKSRSRMSAA